MKWKFRMLFLVVLLLSFLVYEAPFSWGHGDESHEGKMEREKAAMENLHEAMSSFEGLTENIFHAIVFSRFNAVKEYAGKLREAVMLLEGTAPHKNRENIEKYREYVRALIESVKDLDDVAGRGEKVLTVGKFGDVLEVCVACHTEFRD